MKKIILSLAVMLFAFGSFAQNNQNGIITVEGKSSVKLAPEEISFTVNFSVKDENYKQCAEMSVEKIDKIKKLFIKNGIDEELIKTNSFAIHEVQKYDPQLRQSVFEGYEANIPVTIRTQKDYEKNDKIFESELCPFGGTNGNGKRKTHSAGRRRCQTKSNRDCPKRQCSTGQNQINPVRRTPDDWNFQYKYGTHEC
jgi:hypothetical protein